MSTLLDPVVEKLIEELNTPYTSCYCEENVYLACQRLVNSGASYLQDIYAVFLSNPTKTVLIWGQKAALHKIDIGCPVVWDYHVIMVLVASAKEKEPDLTITDRSYVVDFDSVLGKLTTWRDYTSFTFQSHLFDDGVFEPSLQSMFRVIPAWRYIDEFGSDRSHMMKVSDKGMVQYTMPPPSYDMIIGPGASTRGVTNNLMDEFVRMPGEGAPGSVVLRMDEFLSLRWLHVCEDGSLKNDWDSALNSVPSQAMSD
ncbi:unnamed protein product [Rhizoctonia solani]|uniref:Protein N-terminal glutamine amidohydrolase n=1 Tax=Rhizoctonia solani TaxID=456999 RepID=A0A8H2XC48_9AGAM|nr:unnamed protein product [Rhizoctonia solani]